MKRALLIFPGAFHHCLNHGHGREPSLQLKDRGGLKYREIARLPEFAGVRMNLPVAMYRHEKKATK